LREEKKMLEYPVKDRRYYEKITLTGYGATDGFDAVHAVYGDTIGVVVLEPWARGCRGEHFNGKPVWSEDDERNFRSEVRALVAEFEGQPDALIFDPGRDGQTVEGF
jgi:hypothetical protein